MSAGRPSSLLAIISRIEETVDEETAAIHTDLNFDLKASNARKSRGLYELTRAMKGISEHELGIEHRDGMLRLRKKLERNEIMIRAHLDAVGEVASLIQSAIQRAETDGTYSSHEFGR
ncbi:hypothetical protein [Arvimicrobium flavum]|uniref:hypothetical protein n=1 Tax=Arvimicrobium flavum TaxID=3393320 RepID=UPI00237A78B1|nr:hypothetical protein [Mesorhizobium shangrilense]